MWQFDWVTRYAKQKLWLDCKQGQDFFFFFVNKLDRICAPRNLTFLMYRVISWTTHLQVVSRLKMPESIHTCTFIAT